MSREVLVPVADGEPRKGVIVGQSWNEKLSENLWIVEFTHKHTALLTEREVIHIDSSE